MERNYGVLMSKIKSSNIKRSFIKNYSILGAPIKTSDIMLYLEVNEMPI